MCFPFIRNETEHCPEDYPESKKERMFRFV